MNFFEIISTIALIISVLCILYESKQVNDTELKKNNHVRKNK